MTPLFLGLPEVKSPWVPWLLLLVPVLLVLVAGGLRAYQLGEPDRMHFDEVFYAEDARSYLERGVEEERPASSQEEEDPLDIPAFLRRR